MSKPTKQLLEEWKDFKNEMTPSVFRNFIEKRYVILTNDDGYYSEDKILSLYDPDKNKDIYSPFFTSQEEAQNYLDKLFEAPEALNLNFPVDKEDCWIERLDWPKSPEFLDLWRKKAVMRGNI